MKVLLVSNSYSLNIDFNQVTVIACLLVSSFITSIISVPVTSLMFVIILLLLVYSLFIKTISYKLHLLTFLYLSMLAIGSLQGVYNDIPLKNVLGEYVYYLKPVFFFFLGYHFSRRNNFDYSQTAKLSLVIMAAGTILAFLFPHHLVDLASKRLSVSSSIVYGDSQLQHYWVYNPVFTTLFGWLWVTDGGFLLRNPSLLLSALETGFVSFFLSAYFLQYKEKYHWFYFLSSIIILITSFGRSAWIGFIITSVVIFFQRSKPLTRSLGLLFALGITAFVFAKFFEELRFLFLLEGSASIHLTNLQDAVKHIITNPLGTGLGTSGWNGYTDSTYYLYSEGSLLTSMIELGFPFLLFQLFLLLQVYLKSKKLLFPHYCGFLGASFFLPIGFSTFFIALFYSYIGCEFNKMRQNGTA